MIQFPGTKVYAETETNLKYGKSFREMQKNLHNGPNDYICSFLSVCQKLMGINREILRLAVPSILANITVPIVGMVDIAVAGHLDPTAAGLTSAAALIGGIAIGTMLFDLLYWNFGFLRIGTGGLTAQAYGKGDMQESARILSRSIGIALACAAAVIIIQTIFLKAAFLVVDCTPEVRELATGYFGIRIWAAPATLSLMAFKGWFIGMQDGVSPMITDLTVNIMNTVLSIILAIGISVGGITFGGMGFDGIALGTVIAQYSGLLSALAIVLIKYRSRVFKGFGIRSAMTSFKGDETRRFFSLNTDLFIRSLCFIGIYIGFTTIAAGYGDLVLAAGSILMKIMMLFSYFTDGFAYAGEALTGRFIGCRDKDGVRKTVKAVFAWSMGIAVLFMAVYAVSGDRLVGIMTSDTGVIGMARDYLPWLLLMPPAGCAAFTWDGIYIGATASRTMRNAMLWAIAGFFAVWIAGRAIFIGKGTTASGPAALHILLAAYFTHLVIRTVCLSVRYRKTADRAIPQSSDTIDI